MTTPADLDKLRMWLAVRATQAIRRGAVLRDPELPALPPRKPDPARDALIAEQGGGCAICGRKTRLLAYRAAGPARLLCRPCFCRAIKRDYLAARGNA